MYGIEMQAFLAVQKGVRSATSPPLWCLVGTALHCTGPVGGLAGWWSGGVVELGGGLVVDWLWIGTRGLGGGLGFGLGFGPVQNKTRQGRV